MSTLSVILKKAHFTDRPVARTGEAIYQHPLTNQYIALPTPNSFESEGLAAAGWKRAQAQAAAPVFTPLSALQRLWPDLQSHNSDFFGHLLDTNTCKQLIELQPEEHQGRMARWLTARCKALGKGHLSTTISQAAWAARSKHPWTPPRTKPYTYLLSPSQTHAFILGGNEVDGYTLTTFTTGEWATTERTEDNIEDLFVPSEGWTTLDWAAYDSLMTATKTTETELWESAPLHRFLSLKHQMMEALQNKDWQEQVRQQGAQALLGEELHALRMRFFAAPPTAWLDHMADSFNIRLETQRDHLELIDLWMALRTTDEDCKQNILPAMLATQPEAFASLSDNELLALWRSSFTAMSDHLRATHAPAPAATRTQSASGMNAQSMRAVLNAHYGETAINALINTGKLNLLNQASELPSGIKGLYSAELDRIGGITTADNTIYLIGNRTSAATLPGLFLHEVGEHCGLHSMLGPDYSRLTAHFYRLLRDNDTYAQWAARRVPASTRPENIPSEQLAYLIERVANDEVAIQGGEGGYALGQECLSNLRTWLFRTPLCRWMDDIGALDNFTLRPQDLAAMAREAVDHFVDQHAPSNDREQRNHWFKKLSPDLLDKLYRSSPASRIKQLSKVDSPEQLAGYLYALTQLNAAHIDTAIGHFLPALIRMSTGEQGDHLRVIAGELIATGGRLENIATLKAQLERSSFAMWVEPANDDSAEQLLFLAPSAKQAGKWQLNYYREGVGAYYDIQCDSPDEAFAHLAKTAHPVSDDQAPATLQQWSRFHVADDQQASNAFRQWFNGSQAIGSDGFPRLHYHGTNSEFVSDGPLLITDHPSDAHEHAQAFAFGDQASAIFPVYARYANAFDASALPKTITINDVVRAAVEQAKSNRHATNPSATQTAIESLKAAARREESGPYYAIEDFIIAPRSCFGSEGVNALKQLMQSLGFDAIKAPSRSDNSNILVLSGDQIRSAINQAPLRLLHQWRAPPRQRQSPSQNKASSFTVL